MKFPRSAFRAMPKGERIDRKVRQFPTEGCYCRWDGRTLEILLPWPPSNNNYYRHARGVTYISGDGKAFTQAVHKILQAAPSFGDARLKMQVTLCGPTKGKRDVKNFDKGLCDSLNRSKDFAGVYDDDSQIDDYRVLRGECRTGGAAIVTIEAL